MAALWAILAAWRPTTTFHLGPVLFGGGPVGEGVIVVAAVALGAASLGALAADRPRAG